MNLRLEKKGRGYPALEKKNSLEEEKSAGRHGMDIRPAILAFYVFVFVFSCASYLVVVNV
jgi:hypothetical protein